MLDDGFGTKLREARVERHFSRKDLALLTGLSIATIGRIERKEAHATWDHFALFVKYMPELR